MAGIQVWVITGDKQETAVNIGYSCKLIEPSNEIIFLNAESEVLKMFIIVQCMPGSYYNFPIPSDKVIHF